MCFGNGAKVSECGVCRLFFARISRNDIPFLNDFATLFSSPYSHYCRYEQYVEEAYVAFLKQKGQAEQVSEFSNT